jgi:hypothetical protein
MGRRSREVNRKLEIDQSLLDRGADFRLVSVSSSPWSRNTTAAKAQLGILRELDPDWANKLADALRK